MTFFTVVFLAAAFLAAVLVTVVFLEGDFFAGVFFAGVFFLEAAGFLAAVFLAGDFFLAAESFRQESPQSISAWVVSHDAGKRGGTLVTEEESRYQKACKRAQCDMPPGGCWGAQHSQLADSGGIMRQLLEGRLFCVVRHSKKCLRGRLSHFFSGESGRAHLCMPLCGKFSRQHAIVVV